MDTYENERDRDMTILAKALYDNLADAPDELSFRKGDIVTVIEQDVDGLVGWWLCILHGRQGIAPGNRLQILSDGDNRSLLRPQRRGSYSTDDFSDSQDGSWVSDVSPSLQVDYDIVPTPVKADNGDSSVHTDRLSVKELYDIPLAHGGETARHNSGTLRQGNSFFLSRGMEISNLPTTLPRRNLLPKQKQIKNLENKPEELYDHPTGDNLPESPRYRQPRPADWSKETPDNPTQSASCGAELYDVPCSSKAGTLSHDDSPHNDEEEILYDVPQRKSPYRKRSYNISGTPPKSPVATDLFQIPEANAVASALKGLANYDVPRNTPWYDVPKKYDPEEMYCVPKSEHQEVNEVYDVPPKPTGGLSEYGVTTETSVCDELYDIPKKSSTAAPLTPAVSRKNDYNEQLSHGNSEIPIYNKPVNSGKTFSSAPVNNNTEYYDLPSAVKSENIPSRRYEIDQELYDVPTKKELEYDSTYSIPPSQLQGGQMEVYDIPAHSLPKAKPSHKSNNEDTNLNDSQQDVYDTPPIHDINKVMAAVGINDTRRRLIQAADASHKSSDDDDYVDYEEIYGREPPSYLVNAMQKDMPSNPQTPIKPPGPSRQQSILEEVNMDAVKKITLNPDEALNRLAKLHLAVDTAVNALLSFTDGDWLNPINLQTNIRGIREIAGKVKTALRLLTKFGLGSLVNAQNQFSDKTLEDTINSHIEPLIECYYKIKVCLLHLDSNNWAVPSERNAATDKFFATVNAIMILSERIPENCRKLNGVVQMNLQTLFGSEDLTASITPEANKELQNLQTSPVSVKQELKGKLKQLGTIDPKTVRGILDIDHRMSYQASPDIHNQKMLSHGDGFGTLKRRQEAMVNTISRPPVPPKPSLPNNRKSLAFVPPESPPSKTPMTSRIETLVTEYAVESPRIKYNSDPTRSPSEIEKNKEPSWGGSCPSLQTQNTRVTERGVIGSSQPEEPMPNSVSETNVAVNRFEHLQSVTLGRKLASESNVHDAEFATGSLRHSRSASMPHDEKNAKFPSLGRDPPPPSPKMTSPRVSKLDHRDIETLEFFLRQVEAQVIILRGAMKNLTESVEKNCVPQVFVAHSKFVILTAHKVVHAAEEVTERLIDQDVTQKIRRENVHLTDSIRAVVASTKTAALNYPNNNNSLVDMISTVLSLGESVRDIHGEAKSALTL